jgi:hypothetical protein
MRKLKARQRETTSDRMTEQLCRRLTEALGDEYKVFPSEDPHSSREAVVEVRHTNGESPPLRVCLRRVPQVGGLVNLRIVWPVSVRSGEHLSGDDGLEAAADFVERWPAKVWRQRILEFLKQAKPRYDSLKGEVFRRDQDWDSREKALFRLADALGVPPPRSSASIPVLFEDGWFVFKEKLQGGPDSAEIYGIQVDQKGSRVSFRVQDVPLGTAVRMLRTAAVRLSRKKPSRKREG